MSTRYATIVPDPEHGEIVSNIAQIEGAAPEVRFGRVQKVPDGVKIGMVKGGPVQSVAGFGFPQGATPREDPGVTKVDNAAKTRRARQSADKTDADGDKTDTDKVDA